MNKNTEIILSIIHESHEHLTAEQIFFKAKEKNPRIVLATVYNNLNKMVEEGLIRRVTIQGIPTVYDKTTRHDHLICKNCGKIMDVTFDDLSESIDKKLNIKIISYDLSIHYICSDCLKQMQQ